MLSQADRDSRSPQTGLCFISDRNFVLLGALFAYFIPSSVALVFAVLCRAEVRQLETHLYRGGRNYDWSGRTAAGNLPVLISAGKKINKAYHSTCFDAGKTARGNTIRHEKRSGSEKDKPHKHRCFFYTSSILTLPFP